MSLPRKSGLGRAGVWHPYVLSPPFAIGRPPVVKLLAPHARWSTELATSWGCRWRRSGMFSLKKAMVLTLMVRDIKDRFAPEDNVMVVSPDLGGVARARNSPSASMRRSPSSTSGASTQANPK